MALVQRSSETITVSTSAIGITSTLLVDSSGDVLRIIEAKFQHRTGGKVFGDASASPGAGGGSGEKQYHVGDSWKVVGFNDLENFLMIKQTGESDATVDIQLYGN